MFRCQIREGDRLYCYGPCQRGDGEVILERMPITEPHGHIVAMTYHGVRGNTYEASMIWGEAIQLNRMTQRQLVRELVWIRREMEIACSSDSCPEEVEAPGRCRVNRKEYADRIMAPGSMGMTYAQISCLVGISANAVREIHIKEAKQNV